MQKPVLRLCAVAAVISCAGCSASFAMAPSPPAAPASVVARVMTEPNPLSIGDAAAACIEKTVVPLRPQLGQARRDLVRSGAIATTGALIGATIHSRVEKESTKADVALGSSIFAAILGGYQIWRGVDRDPSDYVREAGSLVGVYIAAKVSAGGDATKQQQAVVQFLSGAANLQSKYPDYASFVLTDASCLPSRTSTGSGTGGGRS